MIRGIHHVAVHVRNLDKMMKFYRDAFGFAPIDEGFSWRDEDDTIAKIIDVPRSTARGIMLRAGSCYLEMFEYSSPRPNTSDPLAPFDRGYTHFCVEVTDIASEFSRLRGLGMTFGQPEAVDLGPVKTIYGKDPEGNIIEIQESDETYPFGLGKLSAPHGL